MSNVTSINKKKFLGSYQEDQKRQRRFDGPFLLGVTATLVAPQLIFCFFFGSFFAVVFGAGALGGSMLGTRSYRRFNSPFVGLNLGAANQVKVELEPRIRKSA